MIELSRGVRELHHRVRLNAGFRSDLQWELLPTTLEWVLTDGKSEPQVVLTTDAWGAVPSLPRGNGSSWSYHRAGRGYTSQSKSCCLLCWAQQYGGASGRGPQCVACVIIQPGVHR